MAKKDARAPSLAPGEVVEIDTPAGLAYVQVTHWHPSYPEVLRALPGPRPTRPADLATLVEAPTVFAAMMPLAAALATGRLPGRIVGRARIPEEARAFPTFRMPIRDRAGTVAYWWFWDGRRRASACSRPPPRRLP